MKSELTPATVAWDRFMYPDLRYVMYREVLENEHFPSSFVKLVATRA